MADTKITGLQTPQVTTNPATDVLPIVNIADNSMAASGSTRKITVNQLLGAGGTATLASATISGDLTVATNRLAVSASGVGIGTTTMTYNLNVTGAAPTVTGIKLINTSGTSSNLCMFSASSAYSSFGVPNNAGWLAVEGSNPLAIGPTGNGGIVFVNNGSTAMTLNATGLGVGGAPVNPLTVFAAASAKAPALLLSTAGSPTYGWDFSVDGAVNGNLFIRSLIGGTKTDVLEFDRATGNVGIGVTPSAIAGQTRIELKGSNGAGYVIRSASTNTAARDWVIAANVTAFGDFVIRQGNSQGAEPNSGTDRFYIDPTGNTIFTISPTPPTLTANGQLTVNATSNTNLRFSYRGSDGVTRTADITLV